MKQSDPGQETSEESIDVQDARSRVSIWPIIEAAVSNFYIFDVINHLFYVFWMNINISLYFSTLN